MDTFEKKYNDALDWMRKVYPTLNGSAKEDAEHYFPELKESEDERIRTRLIALVEAFGQGEYKNEMLAYLEKQEEPRDYRKLYEEVVKSDWFKENYVGKSLGEGHQPAEWSEKDKGILLSIKCVIDSVWHNFDYDCSKEELKEMWNWLDTLWQRVEYPQPKRKWSEEDEIRLKEALEVLDETIRYIPLGNGFVKDVNNVKDWLKSLRPQPHWKPSEKQMRAFNCIIAKEEEVWQADIRERIISLFEDLKKLCP